MRAPLVVALAGALLLTGMGAGPAAAVDPATGAPGPAAPVVVPLLTGDTAFVQAGRGVLVLPAQATGIGADLQTLHLGAATYVVPAAARPYLGRYLDPGLFDVARLAAAPPGERLAVRLTLRPGADPQLPGVTITGRTATSATGYLTAASASAFGRALCAQWEHDAAAGWPGDPALFAGVTSLAPVAAAPSPAATPAFPQVTFSLRLLDGDGQPARSGMVTLVNTDDARRYAGFVPVVGGLARVSVPRGHYSAIGSTDTFDRTSGRAHSLLVPVSDLAVTGEGQTLVLDGRLATARPGVSTPRPSTVQTLSLEFDRADASGHGSVSSAWVFGGPSDVRVAPAPAARVGSLHWLHSEVLAGRTGGPSTYDVSYSADSVPADQAHTVADDELATVQARYYGDGRRGEGAFGRIPLRSFQSFAFGFLLGLPLPSQRTEYVLAARQVLWSAALVAGAGPTGPGVFMDDGLRHYRPGPAADADWLRPALLAGVPEPTRSDVSVLCAACRDGNVVTLVLAPVTDSTPGHAGSLAPSSDGTPAERLRLFRDGASVFDRTDVNGLELTVGAAPAAYRLVLDAAPIGAIRGATHTELTFRSGVGQGPPAPSDRMCLGPRAPGCRVLPVLQVRAPLPVGLDGTMPLGTVSVDLAVTHVPGAVPTGIHGVTVETRAAGGGWQAAPVTRHAEGSYRIALTDSAARAGSAVDLRITAVDADGGTITQTIDRAYVVADS